MAGVYTDNQPDFSYLAPGETKTFSQYWYPIREIGPAHQASTDAAVRLDGRPGRRCGCAERGRPRCHRPARRVHRAHRHRHHSRRTVLHAELRDAVGTVVWQATARVATGAPLSARVELRRHPGRSSS